MTGMTSLEGKKATKRCLWLIFNVLPIVFITLIGNKITYNVFLNNKHVDVLLCSGLFILYINCVSIQTVAMTKGPQNTVALTREICLPSCNSPERGR